MAGPVTQKLGWMRFQAEQPGIHNGIELTLRFVLWMLQHRTTPTWQQIAEHFEVHRATAHRWLAAWNAAGGPEYHRRQPAPMKPASRTQK